MQRVERRQPEAIGTFEQMKKLSHELRRTRMRRIPRVGDNQKVGADQLQLSCWRRLVDYDLGASGVQDTATHQGSVYIVEPHCPRVGTAHAAELQRISFRF